MSNQELYRTFSGRESLEEYTDFLAGLAVRTDRPDILIVREKQLSEPEYMKLFTSLWEKVKTCEQELEPGQSASLLIPHTYPVAAEKTGSGWLHLPFSLFSEYQEAGILSQWKVGTSIHSVEEAEEAQRLGAFYVTAGHIFTTDCKKGVPPRGMEFLEQVCDRVTIPVYAIGGIHPQNLSGIRNTKAKGACMMSEYMKGF